MPERKYNPWFQFWAVLWISKDLETRKRARLLAFRKEDNDEISRGYWRSNWPRVLAGPLTGCHCRILREQIVWFCFYFYLFSSITVISFFFISEAAVRFCPSFLTSVDRKFRFDWKKENLFLSGERKVKKNKREEKQVTEERTLRDLTKF